MKALKEIEIEGVLFVDADTEEEVEEGLRQGKLVQAPKELLDRLGYTDEVDFIEVD